MKAMIFAAGLGTRLKPFTDHHPKALAVVNGKTLLQRNIEYLQQHGIREVIVNVHHFADQVVNAIHQNKGWGSVVVISDERAGVLETGGGLQQAAWYFENEKEFVVMNADILTDMPLSAMIGQHRQDDALATLAVSGRNTSRYFLFDGNEKLVGWRNVQTGEEKPHPLPATADQVTQKAFSGIHIIQTKLFSLMHQKGKFSMVDVYLDLLKANTIRAFDHTGARFVDVGKPENIEMAASVFS